MPFNIGAFGENFPYTNMHNLNQDWIIKTLKEVLDKFDEAISAKIKFADPIQWDITQQYEVLTIVMNDNNAYLSMKPVPSGTSIADTNYWQNIFDMGTLYEDIDAVREDLTEDIGEVREELSAEITALNAVTVKTNATKHLLVLGDSYMVWASNALYNQIVARIGIPQSQCHNVAVSGASFQDATNSFLMQVQGYTGNKEAITDILVVGGINDALLAFDDYTYSYPDVSVVTSAMDTFKTYCAQNYPNATINIAYVGGTLPISQYYTLLHPEKSQEWAKWCYTIYAQSIGFRVLETWNAIHSTKMNYDSDGIHPNSYGASTIAEAVASAFNGAPEVVNRPQIIQTLPATGKNTRTLSAFCWVENNVAHMTIPDQYILIRENETIGSDQFYPVIQLNGNGAYMIRTPHYYNVNVSISGFIGLSNAVQCPAELEVKDGVLGIKLYYMINGVYQTLTAGSFSAITFYGIPDLTAPVWEVN